MCKCKRSFILGMILLMLTATFSAYAEPVEPRRNPYIELSTQYPALTVKAGDHLNFDLSLDNYSGESQEMTLSTGNMPDGWKGSFAAGSKAIDIVHVKNGETNSNVDFTVDIPLDAADGLYEIKLSADANGYSDDMILRLNVSSEEIGESSFNAKYPSQEGDAGTAFKFSATIINNTLSDQSYSLSSNAPDGWDVSFTPSGAATKIAALDVAARSTQGVNISVTPPADIAAGTYEIPCTATSVDDAMDINLSVTIKGSYAMSLSTPSGRLSFNAYAKKQTPVTLIITNTGNSALSNVNLASAVPEGWNVTFSNETIELIEVGGVVETTAYITPGEKAMAGDYATVITARNSNASSRADFRVTVKTETSWGIAGIGIIIAMALVIVAVMRKYGRR